MRDDQTDICHGNCGDACMICAVKQAVNFKPRDIRGDFFGIEDPKLEGEGGSEDAADTDEY